MRWSWWQAAVVSSALIAPGLVSADEPAPQLAFVARPEITLTRPDGTERIRLTHTRPGYSNATPAWSPDGRSLAFVREDRREVPRRRQKPGELRIAAVDTGRQRILVSGASPGGVSFSPDGEWIAYTAPRRASDPVVTTIRAVRIDGSGSRALVSPSPDEFDTHPAWSPDGTTIAFTRVRFSRSGVETSIWAAPSAGGTPRRLIADADNPAWSPDGGAIAFTSTRDRNGQQCFHDCGPTSEVYVMAADGTGARRLTRTESDESSPAWSPDGSQIAFARTHPEPEDNNELYVMRADGSCTTRLTNSSVDIGAPAWRPGSAYSAPLVCDGAAPGARIPVMETDLREARRFRKFPLAWTGPRYRGLLLSALDVGPFTTFVYDDCALLRRSCSPGQLQVQTWSICGRHPLRFGGYFGPGEPDMGPHAQRYRRVRKALVAEYPEGVDVYTGRIAVTLYSPRLREGLAIARRLRLFPGSRSALRAPRFDRRTLSRVRRVGRALQLHGMRGLSERWQMSPEQIRAARNLRQVLRPAELRGGTRCARTPRG